ncbi:MAG: GTP-binding protein [Synergistales bacterium]|jgi:G3E family GTPase
MRRSKCGVMLISGFLGSGKTTFLKRLVEAVCTFTKPVVLINEFGKVGIDGEGLQETGLEILEINRGSIFCACAKGDFLRALYSVVRDFKPKLLLVEASGVADTRDMETDLKRGKLADFYEMIGNICVVDAYRFENLVEMFNATSRQVEAATIIVLNKTDLVDSSKLDSIKKHIRNLCPTAPIYVTSYGQVDIGFLFQNVKLSDGACGIEEIPGESEWEGFIESCLEDPGSHLDPPDRLFSQTIGWSGSPEAFASLLQVLPADIVRAKGFFVGKTGEVEHFDYIKQLGLRVSISLHFRPRLFNNIGVFIGQRFDRKELSDLFEKNHLKILDHQF